MSPPPRRTRVPGWPKAPGLTSAASALVTTGTGMGPSLIHQIRYSALNHRRVLSAMAMVSGGATPGAIGGFDRLGICGTIWGGGADIGIGAEGNGPWAGTSPETV